MIEGDIVSLEKMLNVKNNAIFKLLKLESEAMELGLMPNIIKYNELCSMYWQNVWEGKPFIEVDGIETNDSLTARYTISYQEVEKYYNNVKNKYNKKL